MNISSAASPASLPDDDTSPLLVPPQERLALLRTLRDGSVSVTLSSPTGATLPTTLWALDAQGQWLSFSADPDWPQLSDLVDGGEATAVAYLENVRVQFDLHGLLLVHGHGASTLQCGLPTRIYRFQRRNAFRVRPSGRLSPLAKLRHPALPDMPLELRVLDVSIGGCALWMPQDLPPLTPGTLFGQVQIQLDSETQFAAELTLQHVSAQGSSDTPHHGVRMGCAWRPLQTGAQRNLQRWIDQAQKRQRLVGRA